MKKLIAIIISSVLIISSCQVSKEITKVTAQDHLIMSVLWYQQSAEMKALYYQGFNFAKLRLNEDVLNSKSNNKKAVVVDIDETMLDNSPVEGKFIETGKSFTNEIWTNWTMQAKAKALPGAVEFSKYAESMGVEVFYISNRSVSEFDVTLKNLQVEGFAFADSYHLMLKETDSSKKSRREKVSENYEIIILIGDNLGDFSEIFDDRSQNKGFDIVEQYKKDFGDRFIVLPNPMYGTWEKPIYNFKRDLPEEEKYKLRKSNLISY